jgi:hypothetical protein
MLCSSGTTEILHFGQFLAINERKELEMLLAFSAVMTMRLTALDSGQRETVPLNEIWRLRSEWRKYIYQFQQTGCLSYVLTV